MRKVGIWVSDNFYEIVLFSFIVKVWFIILLSFKIFFVDFEYL